MANSTTTEGSPLLMGTILILVAITGAVVVLAAQKYNIVQELESQADTDAAYAELQIQESASDDEQAE